MGLRLFYTWCHSVVRMEEDAPGIVSFTAEVLGSLKDQIIIILPTELGGSLGEGEEGCSNHLVKSLLHLICHAKGVIASLDKWLLFLK